MQPRFIKLHPKTRKKLSKLSLEAASDGAHRVSARINAILLNSDKRTSGEISNILKISPSAVSDWLKTYAALGVHGLMEGKRSGRPSLMTDIDKIILADIIDSGPVAYGLLTGVWTSVNIAGIIQDEFNVSYHPGHVRKILREIGYSVQTPTRLLAAADAEKRAKWLTHTYPEIKKKLKPNLHE
jgi:transposase